MTLQILLAEDEALVAMALADCLEADGHTVTMASDGRKALAAAQYISVLDLLITDLRMPDLGGEELIRALWAERPGLPVLVVTGSAPPGGLAALRREVGSAGPLLLRHKPLNYTSLAQAVQAAVTQIEVLR
ncbi:response regulator [Paracraurococcus lichenis]|uniref:Response regulator n=1 Tax=Paracraurococcus lichenis TaxID=3064888 RepID=A0ABT9EDU4_9PROT|nr:response regulator [Paracraurococcus sp. LOR1-02]MDO9714269.1 response regulator [Paracraurococcus sp. LOR1-02]